MVEGFYFKDEPKEKEGGVRRSCAGATQTHRIEGGTTSRARSMPTEMNHGGKWPESEADLEPLTPPLHAADGAIGKDECRFREGVAALPKFSIWGYTTQGQREGTLAQRNGEATPFAGVREKMTGRGKIFPISPTRVSTLGRNCRERREESWSGMRERKGIGGVNQGRSGWVLHRPGCVSRAALGPSYRLGFGLD